MNSCFLYHAWGLYHHMCLREEYKSNTIILHIESKQAPKCGPQCGKAHLVKNGFRTRYQPSDRWQKGNSADESPPLQVQVCGL